MNGTAKTSITRELIFDAFDYVAANLHPADAKEFEMASGHANFRDRLTVTAFTNIAAFGMSGYGTLGSFPSASAATTPTGHLK